MKCKGNIVLSMLLEQCLSSSWFFPRAASIVILLPLSKISLILWLHLPLMCWWLWKIHPQKKCPSQALQTHYIPNWTANFHLNVNAVSDFAVFKWLHCSHKAESFLKPLIPHLINNLHHPFHSLTLSQGLSLPPVSLYVTFGLSLPFQLT